MALNFRDFVVRKEHHQRAKPFVAVRSQHLQESAEDYTELVAELIAVNGEARVCDIAKRMGISHVTALRTIRRLVSEGYFKTAPHHPIHLTPKGQELAASCQRRHDLLIKYLTKLGVPAEIAARDVEGMEHHVSPCTLKAFEQHMKNL